MLPTGHAHVLLRLTNQRSQELLTEWIVAEGLSVRSTEEIVRLGNAPTEEEPTPRVRRPSLERETAVAALLPDHFDTRAEVAIDGNRGRTTIEFVPIDDLDRIMAVIDGRTVEP